MPRPRPPLTPCSPAPRHRVLGCGASSPAGDSPSGTAGSQRQRLQRPAGRRHRTRRARRGGAGARFRQAGALRAVRFTAPRSPSPPRVLPEPARWQADTAAAFTAALTLNRLFTDHPSTRIPEVPPVTQPGPCPDGCRCRARARAQGERSRRGPCRTELALRVKKRLKTSRPKTRGGRRPRIAAVTACYSCYANDFQ